MLQLASLNESWTLSKNTTQMSTRKTVRFPNTLPTRNRLTLNEQRYLQFIQSEYNDIPTQEEVVNSLNLNNAANARLRNALHINANRTRNLRESRRSLIQSAGPENMQTIRTIRARRRNNHNAMFRNLNALVPQMGQNRVNAMRRRLEASLYRVRLNAEESRILGQLLHEHEDPLVALRRVRDLGISDTSKQRIIHQIMYLYSEAMNANQLRQMQELRDATIRANLNDRQLENVLAASGAFE